MCIYYIHFFISLFIIPSQSIIGKILPNLWQRHLEKPLMCSLCCTWKISQQGGGGMTLTRVQRKVVYPNAIGYRKDMSVVSLIEWMRIILTPSASRILPGFIYLAPVELSLNI